jgi:sn-glycerol 3-phosphate transport system permease protein
VRSPGVATGSTPHPGSGSHRERLVKRSRVKDIGTALLLLSPSLILFGVFVFYPLGRAAFLGLHQNDFFGGNRIYIGFSQYADVLTSKTFRSSLTTTLEFALLTVPTGLVLGLGLAVLADKWMRGISFFRTIFASTIATSVAVASLMFLVLFNPSIGVLTKLLPFDVLKNPGLLQEPDTALLAVAITTVWQNLGFTFIVMSAGLQSIPADLREAALIDGAKPWRSFTNVTLPLLSPTLLFTTVVLTIGAFQSYGQIDLLTEGGPGDKTQVLVYSIYGTTSRIANNEGVQSATAVLLFLMVFVLSVFQFSFLDKRVHYGE